MYIRCKPKDVQSLQSSYFLVFYHVGFETTTLTFSRIIDFDNTINLFLKQAYSCAVVDAFLIWTDIIILISRPVRWDKLYQSTHFKGKLHTLPIHTFTLFEQIVRFDWYGRIPFRSGNNSKFSTIQTVFWKKMRETISIDYPQGTVFRKEMW